MIHHRAILSLLATSSSFNSTRSFSSNLISKRMIVEYLRYTVPAEQRDAFVKDYTKASAALMKSPYAKAFEMSECEEDATKFMLRIEWTSGDDHMKKFRTSDEFKEFFADIKPYLDNIDEMRHYKPLLMERSD
ncbi:MAG: hypothetical protein SGILL_000748 [Bacillariaceae sp.]